MDRATDVPGSLAQSADAARVNDYDSFAEAHAAETENNLVNAYYERPGMLALAGEVAGRRILDAGCGSGSLSAALRDGGAVVTGIDASAGMLELARRRLADDAALHVVDLIDRLPFADGAFDDVLASLVLHSSRGQAWWIRSWLIATLLGNGWTLLRWSASIRA